MDKIQTEVQQPQKKNKFSLKKIVFVLSGFLCFGLGTAGIVLPVLPTVPLYLATAYFFAGGSEKFNTWFTGTKLYKKHLENFVKNRCMTMEKEILLLTTVPALLTISMVMFDMLAMYITIPIIIAVIYSYFFCSIKTTNVFVAKTSSRLIALLSGGLMLAAMFILDNIIIYTVFSVFLTAYTVYFIFAQSPQKIQ